MKAGEIKTLDMVEYKNEGLLFVSTTSINVEYESLRGRHKGSLESSEHFIMDS